MLKFFAMNRGGLSQIHRCSCLDRIIVATAQLRPGSDVSTHSPWIGLLDQGAPGRDHSSVIARFGFQAAWSVGNKSF